ncbi:MAG: DNA N-6-adenine-methyltransferase [Planctomycetota bacterium]
MTQKPLKLKATDSLETPNWLFDRLDAEFRFTLDAAASATNAKRPRHYTVEDDGLHQPWGHERVWCNPPYSGGHLPRWVGKAYCEYRDHGVTVVMLLPVSVSSKWWRDYAVRGEVFYFNRRIKFGSTHSTGLRDSILLVFRHPRWYPLGDTDADQHARGEWDRNWRDLMYPAADLAGRWWSSPSSPKEPCLLA